MTTWKYLWLYWECDFIDVFTAEEFEFGWFKQVFPKARIEEYHADGPPLNAFRCYRIDKLSNYASFPVMAIIEHLGSVGWEAFAAAFSGGFYNQRGTIWFKRVEL